ncbi:hypothetical protein WJN01_06595 [Flavobacteriaceae bacterium SZ-1-7]|uniref:hypothetical protein n=1 Tax=Tamlana sedimenti TaxID=3134126 RepID=UPI003120E7CA
MGLTTINLQAQENEHTIIGEVTFVTSKNAYVRFENTNVIAVGDTLQTPIKEKCLLVTNKSSSSVVCLKLNNCIVNKKDKISYVYEIKDKSVVLESEEIQEDIGISYNDSIQAIQSKKTTYVERIKSRLSAASYSNFNQLQDDNHRLMTRFYLEADHINNSKFSVESYLNYRQNIYPKDTTSNMNKSHLNVYNMAVRYDVDTTLSVTFGRKINYKISSLGAIDGIQAEKFLGNNYVGVIAGFRPDIYDYGFNPNLMQYGGYVGKLTKSKNFNSQTTLGFAEQRNQSDIDRRFAYFQHSSSIFKNLHLFSTLEVDLYNKVNDSVKENARITNFYVSSRYRFNKNINLSLSYDSRKRIIYYKTYETDIERLLDEDIARQGFRARLNVRPIKHMYTGFSYSKRLQSDSQNKSDNIYGYVSMSKLPIDGRLSLTFNMNNSNYLQSNIASLRYSREFIDGRLGTDMYYRYVNYKYNTDIPDFAQHYVGGYFSYYIDRSFTVSLSGEVSIYDNVTNYRVNTQIIKRFFRSKKQKQ